MEDKKRSKTIGKYEIVSRIAQGGMGTVYKAKHPTLGRYVLLKRLALRGGTQFTERFKREATLLMDFKHDGIVQVYDHFKEGSYYYIVEEFVDGMSLEDLIRRERYLTNEAAVLVFHEVCRALKHAHDKGVVHRDVKPANILISKHGDVKLVDFGIATTTEPSDQSLTREGMTLGTPSYIPPEQIGDARNADKRADIYSLGVVLYEAVTGKLPFPGAFNAETISQIQKGKYTPPVRLNPRVSPLLRRIIARCIRPNRGRRFQDLQPVLRMLARRIRRREPQAIREGIRKILKGEGIGDLFRHRRPALVWSGVALVVLAILAAAGWSLARRGYGYEWFLADRYGALVTAVRVPPGYKEPEDIEARALLYSEQGGDLLPGPVLELSAPPPGGPAAEGLLGKLVAFASPVGSAAAPRIPGQGFTMESPRVYLPAGRYRLKMSVDGELTWVSFFLPPRDEQRRHFDTVEEERIEVPLSAVGGLPLSVRFKVHDVRTGADLAGTAASVARGNDWVALTPEVEAGLRSGSAYRFRFDRLGYLPQIYNLLVRPNETRLVLDVALVPVAGTLSIVSETGGVTLLLDDAASYVSGGNERSYQALPALGAETRDLVLDSGEYRLTARRGASSETIAVSVAPNRTTRVRVSLDRASRALVLRTEP